MLSDSSLTVVFQLLNCDYFSAFGLRSLIRSSNLESVITYLTFGLWLLIRLSELGLRLLIWRSVCDCLFDFRSAVACSMIGLRLSIRRLVCDRLFDSRSAVTYSTSDLCLLTWCSVCDCLFGFRSAVINLVFGPRRVCLGCLICSCI